MARWLSRDPIEESGGGNLYRFVRNRSTCLVDRLGLLELKFEFSDGKTITDSTSPEGHAYSYRKLERTSIGDPDGIEFFGLNSVDCHCTPCSSMDLAGSPVRYSDGCSKIVCTIKLTTAIRINTRIKDNEWARTTTYGHEQLHAKAHREAAKNGSAAKAIRSQATICYAKTTCDREAAAWSRWQSLNLNRDLSAVATGGYDGEGHYRDPVGPEAGKDYPPIGTMPPASP